MTVTSAAGALLNLGEDTNLLKRWVDGSLARNPSHAFGWLWSGWIRTVSGEADLAIEHFEMSLRLDPRASAAGLPSDRHGHLPFLAAALRSGRRRLEASFNELPSYAMTIWFLAACYAHMGRLDDARDFAARHGIVLGGQGEKVGSLYGDPAQRIFFLAGLRLAAGGQA